MEGSQQLEKVGFHLELKAANQGDEIMDETKYCLYLEKLCVHCNLGELKSDPVSISGGLLHRMYSIVTTKGNYAVKILNSSIMSRQTALANYRNSEQVARLAATKISAIPAEVINGESIQNIEGHFFLVFNWVNAKPLKLEAIETYHCSVMGEILATIHKIDFSDLEMKEEKVEVRHETDWNSYYQKGEERSSPWKNELYSILAELETWQSAAIATCGYLSTNAVISHRDLDPKNVLWHQKKPTVIDWEAAGFIHPAKDVIETAIYWALNTEGDIDQPKFLAFLKSYDEKNGKMDYDWRQVLTNGFLGKFDWLEYNLKRSLWIECADDEEQELGTQQVMETIKEIRNYAYQIPVLLRWLNDEIST